MNNSNEFERWYAVHVRPCERILKARARFILKDPSLAQDAVQDVLLDIFKGQRWRSIDSPRGYLFCAVHNRALRIISQRRLAFAPLPEFEDLRFADQTPDVSQALTARQELDRLMAFIDGLPPQCRRVVTLRRVEGLSPTEIADMLGVTVSAVEKQLTSGQSRMTKFMSEIVGATS